LIRSQRKKKLQLKLKRKRRIEKMRKMIEIINKKISIFQLNI